MGMAASQARLLSLTARMHDIEYQAQAIQNAKVQLATQSDKAYADYNAALEATTLTATIIDGNGKTNVPASFNTLCSSNRVKLANSESVALHDKFGKLIVEDEEYQAYQKFGNNAYAFAMYMLTGDPNIDPEEFESNLVNSIVDEISIKGSKAEKCFESVNSYLKKFEDPVISGLLAGSYIYGGKDIFENKDAELKAANYDPEKVKSDFANVLKSFEWKMFSDEKTAQSIYNRMYNGQEIDFEKFQMYVEDFNRIKASNGCVSIDDAKFRGVFNGDAANDSDWLQMMIQSGQITMSTVKVNNANGDVTFNTTSPSESAVISYTETTSIDKKELAKAEAKYNQTLNAINKKDKQYDLTLNKLETERTALKTEYDSVKKITEENIERTFGIFS